MRQAAATQANGVIELATQISSKPEKKAPVTRHPLFPAVVAMWFGSLFGLGSLAVRASLIESLVIKFSLDVLLPAAAPPLGLKFRIILALLMAAIGIALGAALARRIARPKQVATPRRREVGGRAAARQARAAAAAAASEPADMTARRRPLAMTNEEERAENYELAPLPGSSPAILDVTQIDIAMNQHDSQSSFHADQPVEAPLDLSAFSDAAPSAPEAEPETPRFESTRFEPVKFEQVKFEPVETAPEADLQDQAAFQPEHTPDRQVFRTAEQAPEAEPVGEIPQLAAQSLHRAIDGALQAEQDAEPLNFGRPFDSLGREPAAVEATAPEPISFHPTGGFAPQAEIAPLDLHAGQEVETGSVADAEANDSEYARMMADLRRIDDEKAAARKAALSTWSDEPPAAEAAESIDDEGEDSRFEPVIWSDEPPVATPPTLAIDAPLADVPVASRVETAPLAELSPVELIERLALAMRQRTQLVAIPSELVAAVTAMARPATDPAPAAEPDALSIFAEPQTLAEPQAMAETQFAPVLESLPAAVIEAVQEPVDDVAEPADSFAPLPAALRPIDFSDFAEHDDFAELNLPPRSFGGPLFAQPAEAEAQPATAEVQPASAEVQPAGMFAAPAPEPEIEADVLEEGYSSLLDLGRPAPVRNDFVRIEEPETEADEIEPVVLFPGHTARPGMRFAAPGAAPVNQPVDNVAAPEQASDEFGVPQLRRFDAPAKIAPAVASGATGAAASALRQDPEEAQRALRAALATLQRMSGAA